MIASVMLWQYPDDFQFPGDTAAVVFDANGNATRATTYYDIAPFMRQLRTRFPAPEGCEWSAIDVCHAQIVRVK